MSFTPTGTGSGTILTTQTPGAFQSDPHGYELGTKFYSTTSGYRAPLPGSGSSPLPYRATGSLNAWARTVGLDTLFIELSTPYVSEFDRNLAGLRAILPRLA